MSGLGFIAPEKPQQCDLCGKIAELRPYGPNGECVCFACGQKNPEAVARGMDRLLFGVEPGGTVPVAVLRQILKTARFS